MRVVDVGETVCRIHFPHQNKCDLLRKEKKKTKEKKYTYSCQFLSHYFILFIRITSKHHRVCLLKIKQL